MASGVIACHWAWGGKLADQPRPGAGIGDAQPADLDAGPQLLLLDGVDLPEVVGGVGRDPGHPGALGTAGAVEGAAELIGRY